MITDFTRQFRLKNLTHFTNFSSFEVENNMFPQYSQKLFWFKIFSRKHASVWYQKKHLHCTISWRPRTAFFKLFERKYLYISVYRKIYLFCSRDVVKFYLVVVVVRPEGGGGEGAGVTQNDFLKVVHCLGLVKCFTISYFNRNF